MIAIVTDSNSQIPPALVARHGITVVPLPVTVDGVEYLEGVDLGADDFYARFGATTTPAVATAQPSPGQFAAIYDRLASAGATEILSVHIGSSVSGTINSARLGAATTAVPVRVVDTGTASFGIALCAWAAADALAAGATLDEAAGLAERTAATVANVFVLRGLELARAGGRLAATATAEHGVPVLSMQGGVMEVIGQAGDAEAAVAMMAERVRAAGGPLRLGIGVADAGVAPLGDALEAQLAEEPGVDEIVRYRVGPSVGAHTGPGTVGVMFAPVRRT